MHVLKRTAACLGLAGGSLAASCIMVGAADAPVPKGFFSFGPDQTITDIDKVEWQPLKLEGLPPGIEIASLRGDLAQGWRNSATGAWRRLTDILAIVEMRVLDATRYAGGPAFSGRNPVFRTRVGRVSAPVEWRSQ
jgi:hypothetical protein